MGEFLALAGRNWPLAIGLVSGFSTLQPVDGRPRDCSLTSNFVVFAPDGTESCWPCDSCPEGQGLTPQCGTRIPKGTKIECKLCEAKKNYSAIRDTSSCNPCHICGLKNVVQECTTEKDRKCGTTCPTGHYYDGDRDECIQCTAETLKNKDCKKLADAQTTKQPTTHPQTTEKELENITFTASLNFSTEQTWIPTQPPTIKTHDYHDGTSGRVANKSGESNWKRHTVAITVGSIGFLLIVILIICVVLHKRKKRGTRSSKIRRRLEQRGLEMTNYNRKDSKGSFLSRRPLLDGSPHDSVNSSTDNVTTDGQVQAVKLPTTKPPNFELIPKDLRISDIMGLHDGSLGSYVTGRLDIKTHGVACWKDIGRVFHVPGDQLNKIELAYRSADSPTECLLETFKTWGNQEPLLKEFADALYVKERTEVAEYICNWPYEKRHNGKPQLNELEHVQAEL